MLIWTAPAQGFRFITNVRWTMGRNAALPSGTVITQERHKGIASIKMHLDPDRPHDSLATLPEVAILRATGAQKPKLEKFHMQWTGADTLVLGGPTGPNGKLFYSVTN